MVFNKTHIRDLLSINVDLARVVLLLLFFSLFFGANVCFAQSSGESPSGDERVEKTSIEEYMESNEPAQQNLEAVQSEVNPQNGGGDSILSRLQKSVEENLESKESVENIEAPQNENDALPVINTRNTNIEVNGFDNIANTTLDVNFDSTLSVEQSDAELEEEIRREAFDAAITGLFPLRPDQIKQLLLEYDATKRVVKEPVHGVPTPLVNVATVSLDPGVAPIIVTTATGHVSTLNILDITGAPWPIQDVSWAGDFEVIEPEEGGHILRITPLEQAAYGNMSIRLLTLKTPITIMLKTSKDEVQYRVDARVPEYGPFAQTPLIQGGAERVAGNSLIISILDGTPPGNAVRLDVAGVDGRTSAFNLNGMTYVRTPLTLLSPGWEQSVSSADGMNVYALNQTPVLLLSDQGRFMRVSLNTAKDLLDE